MTLATQPIEMKKETSHFCGSIPGRWLFHAYYKERATRLKTLLRTALNYNLLERGASFLNTWRNAHMTSPVFYERSGTSISILATVGKTESESVDNNGLVIRSTSRDYIITRKDLVLDGVLTLPLRGDTITEIDADGIEHVYTVLSETGGAVYSHSDDYRNALRIHTKHVRSESP